MKKVLILGAAGFLGSHLEHRLKADGCFVVSAARHNPRYRDSVADEFHYLDLRDARSVGVLMSRHEFDEVYQMAGDVGGLGHIAVGSNDAEIMTNSTKINLAVLEVAVGYRPGKIFFASSQCVYPDKFEVDPFAAERISIAAHREIDAHFDTFAFGQEKLFAEKLYDAYRRNYGVECRVARIGNTFGPYCCWEGPRAKSVAAICRKVAQSPYAGTIDLWGNASQTRSFTYVDDIVEGIIRLTASNYSQPVNLASSEEVTIECLFETICRTAGKILGYKESDGPVGVRSRSSDNTLCRQVLGWEPTTLLAEGLAKTYPWVAKQALSKTDA